MNMQNPLTSLEFSERRRAQQQRYRERMSEQERERERRRRREEKRASYVPQAVRRAMGLGSIVKIEKKM